MRRRSPSCAPLRAVGRSCFGVWIALARAAWPRGRAQWLHLAVTGVLMHAGYLGGVWAAVKAGIGAGTVALLVGLQPVLTALWLTPRRSERGRAEVSARQWLGLVLGLAGLALVVWRKLGHRRGDAGNLALAIVALLGITIGTLYQKRFVAPCDVRTASAVQLLAALVVSAAVRAARARADATGIRTWSARWPGRCSCSRSAAARCCTC